MQTLQQQRAKHALDRVKRAIYHLRDTNSPGDPTPGAKPKKPSKGQTEYRSHTQGLPFMIHANGLGQAYAFYLANCGDKPSYREICDTLAEWLLAEGQPYHAEKPWPGDTAREKLLRAITESEMRVYLIAQAEAVEYMGWVKRFADAFINEQ